MAGSRVQVRILDTYLDTAGYGILPSLSKAGENMFLRVSLSAGADGEGVRR